MLSRSASVFVLLASMAEHGCASECDIKIATSTTSKLQGATEGLRISYLPEKAHVEAVFRCFIASCPSPLW